MLNKGDKVKYIGASAKGFLTSNRLYTIIKIGSTGPQLLGDNDNPVLINNQSDVKKIEDAFKVNEKVYCIKSISNKDFNNVNSFTAGKQYTILDMIDEYGRIKLTTDQGKNVRWGITFFSRMMPVIPTSTTSSSIQRGPHKCNCNFFDVILQRGCQCNGL